MGATYVTVTMRNPAAPEPHWTGRFPVDTGAIDSLGGSCIWGVASGVRRFLSVARI